MKRNIRRTDACQCADRGCPVHAGEGRCTNGRELVLYRIDMHDPNGTGFCVPCAEDALATGVFCTAEDRDTSEPESLEA